MCQIEITKERLFCSKKMGDNSICERFAKILRAGKIGFYM
jgi:hypothetical protein